MSDSSVAIYCLIILTNDEPLQQLLEWYLHEYNINVIVIPTLAEGTAYITKHRHMFALINDQLPHTDALVIAAALRKISAMPVLVLLDTVHRTLAQQAHLFDNNYIIKPFDRDEFYGHIQTIKCRVLY